MGQYMMLLPKQQARNACERIRTLLRGSIKNTHYRFRLLVMGLISSFEYVDIEAPPQVTAAWSMIGSKFKQNNSIIDEMEILRLINGIHDQDLISLIVHGLFYYDTQEWAILDADGNDILY